MKLSEWLQAAALLIVGIAWALVFASLMPAYAWPIGLGVFAVALFGVGVLVEWKSGGRL